MFDANKTRMIGLPYCEKNYDNMLSRFHLIPERHGQTDERANGQTKRQDRFATSISRVSVLTRDKTGTNQVLLTLSDQPLSILSILTVDHFTF